MLLTYVAYLKENSDFEVTIFAFIYLIKNHPVSIVLITYVVSLKEISDFEVTTGSFSASEPTDSVLPWKYELNFPLLCV